MSVSLPNDSAFPYVGLGTWKIPKEICEETVYLAIKSGYRHLDCACDYGNEVEVGLAIKRAIEDGIITRKDLFVTSKLWNTYHHEKDVLPACQKTLKDLGLDYLDLYLIHFPISLKFVDFNTRYPPGWVFQPGDKEFSWDPVPIQETWGAMEKLYDAKLAKNIGVSNFSGSLIVDLLSFARVRPAVVQIEIHPHLPQFQLVKWLQEQKIVVTAYSSFGSISYRDVFTDFVKDVPSLLDDEVINGIAKSHNKTSGQILLRWAVQRECVVVPKSTNETRLKENLDVLDFVLTEEEMKAIAGINQNIRFNDPGRYANLPIFC
mmetsp:Transcript_78616/g.118234  ORF Transcript_78616/g.118234 Transcript_78616/m.118234 type:complete len:319 (-) Transcript_78616:3-959(-)